VVRGLNSSYKKHGTVNLFAALNVATGEVKEDVQILLGHTSIRTTERSYSPWVKARQDRLEGQIRKAWDLETELRTPAVHRVN